MGIALQTVQRLQRGSSRRSCDPVHILAFASSRCESHMITVARHSHVHCPSAVVMAHIDPQPGSEPFSVFGCVFGLVIGQYPERRVVRDVLNCGQAVVGNITAQPREAACS
jgi:hypothetical protein